MIKNIELITNEIQDFSLQKMKFITNFNVSFFKDFGENQSLLSIDFIIEADNEKQYVATFHFHNPESIYYEGGGSYHQLSLTIDDMKERGWEQKRYEVFDYEDRTLSFYCSDIEVTSIKETSYRL